MKLRDMQRNVTQSSEFYMEVSVFQCQEIFFTCYSASCKRIYETRKKKKFIYHSFAIVPFSCNVCETCVILHTKTGSTKPLQMNFKIQFECFIQSFL